MPRNDRPCNRRGRGCLRTPSTDRTSPADTLPPVVSNVRFANSLLGFLIESSRVGPRSRRGMLSTIMEPLKIDPVPLGASQNTDTQTITPLRRCRLNLSLRVSARHTTRTRRHPRRAPRSRHAYRPVAAPAGQHARSRARRFFPLGSSSCPNVNR